MDPALYGIVNCYIFGRNFVAEITVFHNQFIDAEAKFFDGWFWEINKAQFQGYLVWSAYVCRVGVDLA